MADGLCFGLPAGADRRMLLQHIWDMQPCPWCVLQRLIYLAIGLVCLVGALRREMALRLSAVGAGLVLSLAGLWAALYQQLVAAQTDACGLTFADKLIMALHLHELAPWLFVAYASCDRANVPLLGIPFAIWSATCTCCWAWRSAWPAARCSSRGVACSVD
jgi:disulfide bond formation protein DsbB